MRSLVLCFKALIFDQLRIAGAKTIANMSVISRHLGVIVTPYPGAIVLGKVTDYSMLF